MTLPLWTHPASKSVDTIRIVLIRFPPYVSFFLDTGSRLCRNVYDGNSSCKCIDSPLDHSGLAQSGFEFCDLFPKRSLASFGTTYKCL